MKVLEISAKRFATMFFMLCGLASVSFGQKPVATPTPTLIAPTFSENLPVVAGNNLNCAGYIQNAPVNTNFQIVGANEEREQNIFSQNEYIYVSRGASSGAQVGDMLAVIRPRGKFSSKFSKKGRLGIYVQEVGAIEVVKVLPNVSIARVKNSCDNFLLGDLVQPMEARVSPIHQPRPVLDIFKDPSGKSVGNIVLARDGRESPSRNDIVYIDLGREDNVQVGEYLTIFRPLGKGGVLNWQQEDSVSATVGGYESDRYRGGTFSNESPRKSGSEAGGKIVTNKDAKKGRPGNLRQVIGEMVIINVKERTATAVITRTATEIHTGDKVEIQ